METISKWKVYRNSLFPGLFKLAAIGCCYTGKYGEKELINIILFGDSRGSAATFNALAKNMGYHTSQSMLNVVKRLWI